MSGISCDGANRGKKETRNVPTQRGRDTNELVDQLLAGGDTVVAPQQGGLLHALKEARAERALNAEGGRGQACDRGAARPSVELRSATDRQKCQRRFLSFDDEIVLIYARGMSLRESQTIFRSRTASTRRATG